MTQEHSSLIPVAPAQAGAVEGPQVDVGRQVLVSTIDPQPVAQQVSLQGIDTNGPTGPGAGSAPKGPTGRTV